jgi:protein-S-isoprenylcysteine O-methyltransferase Ste14
VLERAILRTPAEERTELVFLGAGLVGLAAALTFFSDTVLLPAVLATVGCAAIVARLCYRRIGHDVYLVFALVALAIGRVLSPLVVLVIYVAGICLLGTLLRGIGMDRLNRSFDKCRMRPSMLVDTPHRSRESFRRQS